MSAFGCELVLTLARAEEEESFALKLDVNSRHIRVSGILPEGLIAEWNREHPEQQVKAGDHIVEVNGVRGDVFVMIDVMRESMTVELHFLQSNEIEQRFAQMEYRNLTPEDYDFLRMLDDAIPTTTGLQRSLLAQLPKTTASDCGVDVCTICMSDDKEMKMTQLTCNHFFCTPCIEKWLTQHRSKCPLCLTPVQFTHGAVDEDDDEAHAHESDIGVESTDRETRQRVRRSPMRRLVTATRGGGHGNRALHFPGNSALHFQAVEART
jgi:hypothetical protein